MSNTPSNSNLVRSKMLKFVNCKFQPQYVPFNKNLKTTVKNVMLKYIEVYELDMTNNTTYAKYVTNDAVLPGQYLNNTRTKVKNSPGSLCWFRGNQGCIFYSCNKGLLFGFSVCFTVLDDMTKLLKSNSSDDMCTMRIDDILITSCVEHDAYDEFYELVSNLNTYSRFIDLTCASSSGNV